MSTQIHYIRIHGVKIDRDNKVSCRCNLGDTCKNIGKHPKGKPDTTDTTDINQVRSWLENGDNVAIRTGNLSGITVIDIDDEEKFKIFLKENRIVLPTTYKINSGRGSHLYFEYDPRLPNIQLGNDLCIKNIGIDVIGDRKQINSQGSVHKSGKRYERANSENNTKKMPEDFILKLLEIVKEGKIKNSENKNSRRLFFDDNRSSGITREELGILLDNISPDLEYDRWVKVGMAIKSANGTVEDFDSWSRSGKSYTAGEPARKFDTFSEDGGIGIGTLFSMSGITRSEVYDRTIKGQSISSEVEKIKRFEEDKNIEIIEEEVKIENKKDIPKMLRKLEPITKEYINDNIGKEFKEFIRIINFHSPQDLSSFGFSCGLSFFCLLMCGRYEFSEVSPNLYLIILGQTGSGKSLAMDRTTALLYKIDKTLFGGDSLSSSEGLVKSLERSSNLILTLDEFGKVLEEAFKKESTFKNATLTMILKLFTKGRGVYHIPTKVSEEKGTDNTIERPLLNILGASTPSTIWDCVKDKDISSGFLPRFLIIRLAENKLEDFKMPTYNEETNLKNIRDKDAFIERIKLLSPIGADVFGHKGSVQLPKQMRITDEAREVYSQIFDYHNKIRRKYINTFRLSIVTRQVEIITKIAMCIAFSENIFDPIITDKMMLFAYNFVLDCLNGTMEEVNDHIHENERDRNKKRVYKYIAKNDGGVRRADISKRFGGINKIMRDELLDDLVNEGSVVKGEAEKNKRGKPTIRFSVANKIKKTLDNNN